MKKEEKHWHQRFSNFNRALGELEGFMEEQELNKMEEQGLIKAFEYTFDLSWETLQDFLLDKGCSDVLGSGPVIEQSFHDGYITERKKWMQMLKSRNLASLAFKEEIAKEIIADIRNKYFTLLKDLQVRLEEERTGNKNPFFDA